MKIIIVEGLKGSGKSTLADMISSRFNMHLLKKFTKGDTGTAGFLSELREHYQDDFINLDYSLGVKFYSNFFNRLDASNGDVVCDRGLLSLPYFGYYGYYLFNESISLKRYNFVVDELYGIALQEYDRLFAGKTLFLNIECGTDEIKRRLTMRTRKLPSDKFFLENLDMYINLKERFDKMAMNYLKSRFLPFRNDYLWDLDFIIDGIEIDYSYHHESSN